MKTKTRTSKRRHPAASRRRSKRATLRRTHAARQSKPEEERIFNPVLVEGTIIETVDLPVFGEPDKREEELSDEEILDREEKQHLY